jgi:hypothetical protein
MKMKNLLVLVFAFIAISCAKDDEMFNSNHQHKGADTKIETKLGVKAAAVVTCPNGYLVCGLHGDCVPYRTSYVCGKNVNQEFTTQTISSLVCSWTSSSTAWKAHNYQVTWYSYVATADRSGHTKTTDYKCSNTLSNCGIACGQTKTTYSGWLAHSPGANPLYCAYCGIKYR